MKVSIYCGESGEPWGPESLKGGVGGSEQAVIYLARQFEDVYVYNGIAKSQTDLNVQYLPCSSISEEETDALIVWRTPGQILKLSHVKAKKKILWLHDLVDEMELLPFIHHYDLVVLATKFHRSIYPNIPDHKFKIIPLGIDIESISKISLKKRNPWKICYFSAYDRGLRVLLEDWTKLKLTFPKLELVVGYGWETMDRLATDRKAYKFFHGYIESMFNQEGIKHLGRVGQERVLSEMACSQLLAYPSIWPETFCLVAVQAQAMGAVPVTTPLAALSETVNFGYKRITEPEWYEAMVEALAHSDDVEFIRSKMILETRNNYSWESIAKEWNSILSV